MQSLVRSDAIPYLVPDLPSIDEALPWLKQIDQARWYTNFGPLMKEFELQAAKVIAAASGGGADGVDDIFVAATCSGTAALETALLALNLPPGSKILLPSFTFPATGTAILRAGMQPVFTEVSDDSWLLTPAIARTALGRLNFDAVMPVGAFGCPLPVDEWDGFCLDTGIPVLIDAAAGFGNQAIGKHTTVVFSLHATKPLGVGEGGLVVSHSAEFIDQVRRLSNFGFQNGEVRQPGTNAKMSEYHAAVGLAQLKRWPEIVRRRAGLMDAYLKCLRPNAGKIRLQRGPGQWVHGAMPVRLPRDMSVLHVAGRLERSGIGTRRWYYPPLHRHPAFAAFPRIGPKENGDLPITDRLGESLLGLPFHPYLDDAKVSYVCRRLEEELSRGLLTSNG